jgi:sugar phosphate isomerase/epimerase
VTDARTGFVVQTGMTVEDAARTAAEAGLNYLELMTDGDHAHHRLDPEALRATLGDHGLGLAVHLPFGGLDLGSPYDTLRTAACRTVESTVEAAAAAGADRAVAHAAGHAWRPAWDRTAVVDALVASMDRLAAHGRRHGVEVCFENVPAGPVDLDDFPALFDRTGASATLDTGHGRMQGYDGAAQGAFLRDHGDRVGHLHLNDTRRARDEHLPFGSGNFDFGPVFDALAATDWSGTLSLEVFTPDLGYVETSADRLHAALDGR